ncbi:tetratricopeptide repeat protein [Rubrolithibacter danxiaensis]|uniref:tetratricopeptide repeat protein n=1 Tax=Rubrolithibacter danxiaensis TaxID=3390805 RepID=UPI003BF91580
MKRRCLFLILFSISALTLKAQEKDNVSAKSSQTITKKNSKPEKKTVDSSRSVVKDKSQTDSGINSKKKSSTTSVKKTPVKSTDTISAVKSKKAAAAVKSKPVSSLSKTKKTQSGKATKKEKAKLTKYDPSVSYIFKTMQPYTATKLNPMSGNQHVWMGKVSIVKASRQKRLEQDVKDIPYLLAIDREKEAILKAKIALNYSEGVGNTKIQLEILNLLARYCTRYKVWDEAEKYYRIALTRRLIAPDYTGYGSFSRQLSQVLLQRNQFDSALKYALFAVNEFSTAVNPDSLAPAYLTLAKVYYAQGNLSETETILLKKALPLYSYVENNSGRMYCFELLGKLYYDQGRNSEAKWFFIQQNTLAKQLNKKESMFNSLVNLGRVKSAIGDFGLALGDFRKAQTSLNKKSSVQLSLYLEEAYMDYFKKQGKTKFANEAKRRSAKLKGTYNKTIAAQRKTAMSLLNTFKEQKLLYVLATDKVQN